MPITSSAKKAHRRSLKRAETRKPFKTALKSVIKKVVTLAKTDISEAQKSLSKAFSVIDTAAKKNIIHKNNASRKKARLSRLVSTKK